MGRLPQLGRNSTGESAIEISDVTVQYPVGPFLRGSLKENLFGLLGAQHNRPRNAYVDAIIDLDLSIAHGERVALIGTNGSGKSTLLRSIGGIYPLKSGQVRVRGTIGSLLDISLGFEAEATGRENIYHRGMAMGVSPRQIREAEADIVAFADLGEFIDLPTRTYSLGMWVRLGFAVSTQFAPDILLVDEVFGAGDAGFAQRAIRRMEELVANSGILVLATHDLALVESICTRAIWLGHGKIVEDGTPGDVISKYRHFVTA